MIIELEDTTEFNKIHSKRIKNIQQYCKDENINIQYYIYDNISLPCIDMTSNNSLDLKHVKKIRELLKEQIII
jgi:hypothetical protein